jgi:hypothetical protein
MTFLKAVFIRDRGHLCVKTTREVKQGVLDVAFERAGRRPLHCHGTLALIPLACNSLPELGSLRSWCGWVASGGISRHLLEPIRAARRRMCTAPIPNMTCKTTSSTYLVCVDAKSCRILVVLSRFFDCRILSAACRNPFGPVSSTTPCAFPHFASTYLTFASTCSHHAFD